MADAVARHEAGDDVAGSASGAVSLRDVLNLHQIARSDIFVGVSIKTFWGRVFGGQIMAQAVVAASRTVPDDRPMHSIHGYFILAGRPDVPTLFRVHRARDGGSFTTRTVEVLQENRIIFTMMASFHRPEPGPEFQVPVRELRAMARFRLADNDVGERSDARAVGVPSPAELIERGVVPTHDQSGEIERISVGEGDRWMMLWVRYVGPEGAAPIAKDDWRLHQALVTYMSDFHMVHTIMQPHFRKQQPFSLTMSLDHALHFHHEVDATSWLLFHIETNASAGARGLARADVFAPSGRILASITQEGLIRVPRGDAHKMAPKL